MASRLAGEVSETSWVKLSFMLLVKVALVPKRSKVGPLPALPITLETAVASPKARPMPKISPAKMPLRDAGMMTLK